jgi:hypothetical protein
VSHTGNRLPEILSSTRFETKQTLLDGLNRPNKKTPEDIRAATSVLRMGLRLLNRPDETTANNIGSAAMNLVIGIT